MAKQYNLPTRLEGNDYISPGPVDSRTVLGCRYDLDEAQAYSGLIVYETASSTFYGLRDGSDVTNPLSWDPIGSGSFSLTGSFVTITEFNNFTSSVDTFSASYDSRINSNFITSSNILNTDGVYNNSPLSQSIYSASLSGGGDIDTGSFATTGSNTFIGEQIISGSTAIAGHLLVKDGATIQNPLRLASNSFAVSHSVDPTNGNYTIDTKGAEFFITSSEVEIDAVLAVSHSGNLAFQVTGNTNLQGNLGLPGITNVSQSIYNAQRTEQELRGEFNQFTSSYTVDSASFDTRIDDSVSKTDTNTQNVASSLTVDGIFAVSRSTILQDNLSLPGISNVSHRYTKQGKAVA